MATNPLRQVPSVTEILISPLLQELSHPHDMLVAAVRSELDALRKALKAGQGPSAEVPAIASRVLERLSRDLRPKLRRVVNATGIALHTNLGRAPLAEPAAQAAFDAARGYLNLELDLDTGQRSSRQDAVREWLVRLTRAESSTAVNNNAAATVLVLRALCQGKEVVVSRGQLIEIGGSFRIPEIMEVSGARLREVGTTNITRLRDYEQAIGPATGALMLVHSSNYRIRGFTESVALPDLVALGRKHGLPVIDDVGSGALIDYARFGFTDEPLARNSVAAGADLVLFSGDKLLGGPQAGLIVGRAELIRKVEKDPLMRAFRLDKMTLAALEATLRLYLDEERALREVPVLRMLGVPLDELRRRAEGLAERLRQPGVTATARPEQAFVGGGSLPDQAMPTWVVAVTVEGLSDAELARRLRLGDPAILGRLHDSQLLLDLRTIFTDQEDALVQALRTL